VVGGHIDLITQKGRLVQHRLQVVEGRLKELSNTFTGEPERVAIPNDIDVFTKEIWENLNEENKIALAVRYYAIEDGGKTVLSRLINKYSK
jgi:hypothetical protein